MHTRSRTWPLNSDPVQRCRDRTGLIDSPDGSTLSLDFTTGVLDPRLTFTRLSNATFINSSGLVEIAGANMFRNSVLVGGGGLNTPPTSWTNAVAGATYTVANNEVKIETNAGGTARAYMFANYFGSSASGLRYTIQFVVTARTGSAYRLDELVGLPSNPPVSGTEQWSVNGTSQPNSHTGWGVGDTITYSAVTTGGSSFFPSIGCGIFNALGSTTSVTITRPQMNLGSTASAYYANSSTSAGYHDVPRFDYDPTAIGTPRGLLIEGSATNLVLNSSLTSTGTTTPANWSKFFGTSGSTVQSVDSTRFPGMKAWSITANVANVRDFLGQPIALAANKTYTVSVYVESVTGTLGLTGLFCYFDSLPAGATFAGIFNPVVGRNVAVLTMGANAGTANFRIGIGTSATTDVTANAQVTFSHVQIEEGSGASSYIPTGASQGNRSPDFCYQDGISSWFTSQSSLTMLVDATPRVQTSFPVLWILTDAGGGNSYQVYYTSSGTTNSYTTKVIVGFSGTSESTLASSVQQDTRQIIGYAIASGVGVRSRNGVSGTAAVASSLPTTALTRLAVGSSGSGLPANAHIRRIKYWPYALTQNQLNGATTP